ncbi:helix-turn-helix transcriptional regulator [Streptomyces sp. NPDC050263]|uniref:helix-turn-helix domain-containing protein n=1 Tax=Streptomyces sp. NPDC050263 TaxID=3155037 RepID=UPI00341C6748
MPRDSPNWITERRRDLGERIGDLRAAAHHTQETLCAATGISRSHLQRIEAGQTDPRYGELLLIAAALDQTISVLVDLPE